MEVRYQHTVNGQEVRQQDINSISETGSVADDRVLWEMLRLLPGSATPQKGIIPYGVSGWGAVNNTTALVWGNTADALVHINPFRAVVGSTTAIATSPVEHLRGSRSGYLVGTSTLYRTVTIAANATANPRWTLVYATITPDADGDSALVLRKDPDTSVVGTQTVILNKKTTVTVSTVDGTPAASPTRPALPSDGAGSYHIALAYVFVPSGFGATSTVLRQYIHEVAPCLTIHSALGASNFQVANQSHVAGGTVDTNQAGSAPTGPAYYRPGAYLPSTMVGGEQRIILLQRGVTPHSHADGDAVDTTVDWRYRYFKYTIQISLGFVAGRGFPSDRRTVDAGGAAFWPNAINATLGVNKDVGQGQSFINETGWSGVRGAAMYVTQTQCSALGAGEILALYVSLFGELRLRHENPSGLQAVVWLEATAPYANFASYSVA